MFIEVVENDSNVVLIQVYYKASPLDENGRVYPIKINSQSLINGNVDGIRKNQIIESVWYWKTKISPYQKITIPIIRDSKDKVVYGTLNAGNLSASFTANPYQKSILPPLVCRNEIILFDACTFIKSESLNIHPHITQFKGYNPWGYGYSMISNTSTREQQNKATYRVNSNCAGKYKMEIRYASAAPRPVEVIVNSKTVNSLACPTPTGGWYDVHLKWYEVRDVYLNEGINKIVLFRKAVFPHIREIRLTPILLDQSL